MAKNIRKTRRAGHGFGQSIGFRLVRGARTIVEKSTQFVKQSLGGKPGVTGTFSFQLVGADGTIKSEGTFSNGVTNEGLDRILNTMFDGKTQIGAGAWFLSLIDTGATLAAGDTYASHAGWTELDTPANTVYDETTRPAWNPAASTAQSSTNSTTVDFTINSTQTVFGIALSSVSTKGDSTSGGNNVLWATGAFPGGDQAVVSGDVLKITYTVNAAAA